MSLYTKYRTYLLKRGWTPHYGGQRYLHENHPAVYFYIREGWWYLHWNTLGQYPDMDKIAGGLPIDRGSTFAEIVVAAHQLEEGTHECLQDKKLSH
jgi:hypothetical protein